MYILESDIKYVSMKYYNLQIICINLLLVGPRKQPAAMSRP